MRLGGRDGKFDHNRGEDFDRDDEAGDGAASDVDESFEPVNMCRPDGSHASEGGDRDVSRRRRRGIGDEHRAASESFEPARRDALDVAMRAGSRDARKITADTGPNSLRPIGDPTLSPFRRIVLLEGRTGSGGIFIGTGWFVGPNTLITAGHCFWGENGDPIETFTCYPGGRGHQFESAWKFTVPKSDCRVHASFIKSRGRNTNQGDSNYDYGALLVKRPVGETVGSFGLWVAPPNEISTSLINISGFDSSRRFHGCTNRAVRVASAKQLRYGMSTTPGTSGAPVYVYEGGHQFFAVGIHTHSIDSAPENGGVYIDDDAAAWLAAAEKMGRQASTG